jgi:GDP-mannose 6-dehydrogenase
MKVSIFGLGYVGCVTAGCLSKDGHEIIGVDVTPSKVERLASGHPTVVEVGLDALIAEAHRQGRLTATTDGVAAVLATDASIICVGTPTGRDGSLELSAVRQTAELIGRAMREKNDRHVVIVRSTVPAGTTESLVLPALNPDLPQSVLLQDSEVVIVPEFLREGSAIADYYDPPFVVIGSATGKPDTNAEVIEALFGGVTERLNWMPYRETELLKAVCNGFHALKVAWANEIGSLCNSLSIDGHALMAQFVQDRKLNISPTYLRPGLAFGGSCLPKDLRMLVQMAAKGNVDLPLIRSILTSNDAHLKRAMDSIPKNGHRRIGLNGLAFKIGTDDLRESPIVLIAEHLIGKGYEVIIHDPAIETSRITGTNRDYIDSHIPHLSKRLVATLDELIEKSDLLVATRDAEGLLSRMSELGKRLPLIDLSGRKHRKPASVAKQAIAVLAAAERSPNAAEPKAKRPAEEAVLA